MSGTIAFKEEADMKKKCNLMAATKEADWQQLANQE